MENIQLLAVEWTVDNISLPKCETIVPPHFRETNIAYTVATNMF